MSEQTFYITTPIYYPNDKLHIGHTYTTVAADALARYHRLLGHKTWFLTGTDEHGLNVERAARQAGKEPLEYVDPIVAWIKELWATLDIQYDDFIRTTEERHKRVVQHFFQRLYDQGDIYKGAYKGLYCANCEAYYTEDELKEGRICPVHEKPVEWVEEESYFFRLSKYGPPLLEHIKANPDFVQPVSRRNEVVRFIERGLEDLSVSRTSFRWGIPVPFDEKHVIYVWIDALTNYISALGYPDGRLYETFWPADVHLIGKDILRFHAIIWPAILMALGLPLPKSVYGHGWLLIDGGKIGKSRAGGQVVDPKVLVRKYGVDAVRYFLLREVPFGADGTYSEEALVRRINADLANDLGNLVWRTVSMIERFTGGRIPEPAAGQDDGVLQETAERVFDEVEAALDRFELDKALQIAWELPKRVNKYIDENAPWELHKQGREAKLRTVLYNAAEAIRLSGVLVAPFLVHTPGRIWAQLGLEADPAALRWQEARRWGGLTPGLAVNKSEPLFPRIDLEEALEGGAEAAAAGARAAKAGSGEAKAAGAPARGQAEAAGAGEKGAKPPTEGAGAAGTAGAPGGDGAAAAEIDINTFAQVDLRVAEVLEAQRIQGADRLLKLQVSVGGRRRQVVAGIAQHYDPQELVGRRVILVANLKPAKLRGEISEGMVLAATDEDGVLSLLTTDKAVKPGSKVR
ncbi:MAG: methionine--tRNA ligase [Limnochordales bacterium]|nr:MAG: methionine--tRNA ligase [Bacillota bacterium]